MNAIKTTQAGCTVARRSMVRSSMVRSSTVRSSFKLALILVGALPAAWLSAGDARASGYASLDMSAAAAGAGNAFTASADDATAMHYNPSGLAWQPGVSFAFAGAMRFENVSAKQTAALGTPYNGRKPGTLVGLYGGWMPAGSDWGVGLSVDRPFTLNSGYDTAFGGTAKRTSIDTLHGGLNVIHALSSSLAVSLGGDLYSAQGDVDSTTTTFSGRDRTGFGGNLSVMWHPRPAWSVGALLRSGATLKLSGTAVGAVSGPASVKVKLPDVARLGVAHVFADRFRVELDTSWTRWSTQKNLNVLGATSELNPVALRDSFGVMTGLNWFFRENAAFRFGYAFDQAATKDSGFSARIVDNNAHRISLGAGGDIFDVHIDLAYVYSYSPNRTINNGGVYDGTWRNRRQSLAMTVAKQF